MFLQAICCESCEKYHNAGKAPLSDREGAPFESLDLPEIVYFRDQPGEGDLYSCLTVLIETVTGDLPFR